jgi:LuxR family maltose regulon positive regulatory protein
LLEYELALLARIRLARYRRDGDPADRAEALAIVKRLRTLAEAQDRVASAIELGILEALVHAAGGDVDAAADPLERALRLAEPERSVRVFTVEGDDLERLLREVGSRRSLPPFAGVVAAALRMRGRPAAGPAATPADGVPGAPPVHAAGVGDVDATAGRAVQPLLDPLTERELEVLRLIADGLSNRDIAARLYRALPTVKGYTREIFAKLQVHRRTEAVARARELGLL